MRNRMKKALIALLAASVLSTSAGFAVLAEETPVGQAPAEAISGEDVTIDNAESAGTAATETEGQQDAAAEDAKASETENEGAAEESEEEIIPTFSMDAANFDDISSKDWFHSYVSWVFSKNIMTGKGDNKFAPGETLSRAQFATVLHRIAGVPDVAYFAKFPDVPEGTFYSKAVSWATQDNIQVITGYEDGRFGSSDLITREQMATMLYRYYVYSEYDKVEPADLGTFPDAASVSSFAAEAMKWAVGAKIISGDQGHLNPHGDTSRAVCATMITRFCEKFMPGQLPDIDLSASCGEIKVEPENVNTGTFRVKIYDVKATTGVSKLQVSVWCNSYDEDSHRYNAERQEDGSYMFVGSPANHKYHSGTYKMDVYALLESGVRLYVGNQTTEVIANEISARVSSLREGIYNEVGRDLYQCYLWSVMPYYAQGDSVPDAYTPSQWYSIYGMENGRGDCQVMAATFYQLALGLGYEARYLQGYVPLAAGGMGDHGWVEIDMGGTTYVFDPDFQSETGRNGYQISYGMSGTWRYTNSRYVD